MMQNQTQGKRIARGTTIFQNSHCTPRLETVNERDTGLCFHPPPPPPPGRSTLMTLRKSDFFLGFLWLILIHIIYYYLRYQHYG